MKSVGHAHPTGRCMPLPRERGTKRRGAVLIVVLVCLMMATALFVLVVEQALRSAGRSRRAVAACRRFGWPRPA